MSWGLIAVGGGSVIGAGINYLGQSNAANQQADAAKAGQKIQQQEYNQERADLSPYREQGLGALTQAGNLSGANGADAQQTAINGIQNGAIYQGMQAQGNKSILQAQSATGGLRTGSTQDILAQYSPQLLNTLINQQFGQNYQLSGLGENAAAMTGQAGMNNANQQSALLQQAGAANAGASLAGANAGANIAQIIGNVGGQLLSQNNTDGVIAE